jgi:GT2 family glycosyltransferase
MITGIMKDKNLKINYNRIAWKLPGLFDDFLLNSALMTKVFNPISYKPDEFFTNEKIPVKIVDCIPGSCFVIRFDIFEKIGFFDENTFLYCEERIIGNKIKKIGYKIGLSLNDYFIHKHESPVNLIFFLRHYVYLIKSRIYYLLNYTQYGKYFYLFTYLLFL